MSSSIALFGIYSTC